MMLRHYRKNLTSFRDERGRTVKCKPRQLVELATGTNDMIGIGKLIPVIVGNRHRTDVHESTPNLDKRPEVKGFLDLVAYQSPWLKADIYTRDGELPDIHASVLISSATEVNGKRDAQFIRQVLLTDEPAVAGQAPMALLRSPESRDGKRVSILTSGFLGKKRMDINRQAMAERESRRTLEAAGFLPTRTGEPRARSGLPARSGAMLAIPAAAGAPREPTDPKFLEVKQGALELLRQIGINVETLPPATMEDLDWALRNFSWVPNNPDLNSVEHLAQYLINGIFNSFVKVRSEEQQHGKAAVDVSTHAQQGSTRQASKPTAGQLRRPRQLDPDWAVKEADRTLAAAGL